MYVNDVFFIFKKLFLISAYHIILVKKNNLNFFDNVAKV
jgi:hypothetical protein